MDLRDGRAFRPSLFFSFKSAFFLFLLVFAGFLPPAFAQYPASFNPATLAQGTNSAFFDMKGFGADDAVPLEAIFLNKGWNGPFSPHDTNHLDMFWNSDVGVSYKTWRLAAIYRGELFLQANRDAIELLRMIELKQNLPVGKTFNVNLNARGFAAEGLEVSKGFDLSPLGIKGLSIGVTARYLKGQMIQQGSLTGTVVPQTAKSYDFNLFLDYVYNHNYIYNRPDTVPGTGDGYSFDIGLKYVLNPSLSGELIVRDLLGRIYWHKTPFTTATATSQTKFFDENGYMQFRPTISGYESYKDFTQYIPLKTDATITYTLGRFQAIPTVTFIEYERPLYWIDAGYRLTREMALNLGYNFNYNAVSAGFAYGPFSFGIYGNSVDLARVSALGVNLALMVPW